MIKGGKNRRNEEAIATLGRNIKKYRERANLSQQALAILIDSDDSQISRMERFLISANISVVWDIATALKIKPSQLLEEPGNGD